MGALWAHLVTPRGPNPPEAAPRQHPRLLGSGREQMPIQVRGDAEGGASRVARGNNVPQAIYPYEVGQIR